MKSVFWIVILIIVIIAIYNAFLYMKEGIKYGTTNSLFKVQYELPKGYGSNTPPSSNGVSNTGSGSGTQNNQDKNSNQNGVQGPQGSGITPPAGFTADQISPSYRFVRVSGVSPMWNWTSVGQFSLQADWSLKKGIDITGWRVRSNRGEVLVPQAVSNYDPSGLSPAGDIVLSPGAQATFYSSASPMGQNFRMNKCVGYLNNTYKFNPSISSYCPNMYDRSEITGFSGKCQNLIFSLGGCSTPSAEQLNSVSYEPACREFLDRFNYTGCYRKFFSNADFFSNEWKIWLGSTLFFDSSHDKVQLFDKDGLLVDQYIY